MPVLGQFMIVIKLDGLRCSSIWIEDDLLSTEGGRAYSRLVVTFSVLPRWPGRALGVRDTSWRGLRENYTRPSGCAWRLWRLVVWIQVLTRTQVSGTGISWSNKTDWIVKCCLGILLLTHLVEWIETATKQSNDGNDESFFMIFNISNLISQNVCKLQASQSVYVCTNDLTGD